MRTTAMLGLAAMVLLTACPDDTEPTSDTTSDIEVTPDVQPDPGAEVTPDVEPDVEPDTPPDVQPDTPPDVEPDVPVATPDGKLGSPCGTNDDCLQDPFEQVCFLGFCAAACDDDNGDPIPNACSGDVSEATLFGNQWGCANDIGFCMPGQVVGKNLVCTKDSQCTGFGADAHCAGAVLVAQKKVDGVCLPTGDERAESGEPCLTRQDCRSWLCLGADPETNTAGVCADHCSQNADCPGQNLCIGIGFVVDDEGTVGAWAGACLEIAGELTYCTKQSDCSDGNICDVFTEPSTLGKQTWCVEAVDGGKAVGEACQSGDECYSGRCLFGGIEGIDQGYCSNVCGTDPADCAGEQQCRQVALHGNGTPDNLNDDPTFGLCALAGDGDYCFVAEPKFCAGGPCEQIDGGAEGIGTCQAPLGCDDPGGPVCDDGLACTVDACVDNACDFGTLEADTCLIAGACYAAGDPNPTNPCEMCSPGDATDAWTAVTDGTACDAGDPCLTGDTCQSGVCTEGSDPADCDDDDVCTEDTCETGVGCDNAPLTGTPCDDGDACTENDQCDAGTCTAGTALDCDDSDACNGTETCDSATGCVAGTALDCDDGFDCTTDSCDPTDGCQYTTDDAACDDGAPCTEESCQVGSGCVYAPDDAICGDSDVCDGSLTCDPTGTSPDSNGCVNGAPLDCDDGDPCTDDSCDPITGCAHADNGTCVFIDIQGFAFNPADLTVPVGTRVRWTNLDSAPHTATSDDATTFDSGTLAQDQSWDFVFDSTGTFPYHCSIHSSMTASITVE